MDQPGWSMVSELKRRNAKTVSWGLLLWTAGGLGLAVFAAVTLLT